MEHCYNHKDREGIYYTNAGHNLCPDCCREYLQNKKRGKIAGMGDSLRMAELDDAGLLYYREHQISQTVPVLKDKP